MYLCIAWQIFTDDPARRDQINRDVDRAFATLARAKLLQRIYVVRPTTETELNRLRADLDNIEHAYDNDFGFVMLFHTDRDPYYGSDPFDLAAARAVTRTDSLP